MYFCVPFFRYRSKTSTKMYENVSPPTLNLICGVKSKQSQINCKKPEPKYQLPISGTQSRTITKSKTRTEPGTHFKYSSHLKATNQQNRTSSPHNKYGRNDYTYFKKTHFISKCRQFIP